MPSTLSFPTYILSFKNMLTPPTPALSYCDTLSSPDLDAYLDSLPHLDSLPSPPMKEAWWKDDRILSDRHDSIVGEGQYLC